MSERSKAGLVDEATNLILDAEDADRNPQRIWVHIHEIPDGNLGAVGQIIQFAQLRQAAQRSRESTAQQA
jgi:phenylpyruvate tautomerase PptA (4-oxalocrotonate tautomerase family)